MSKIYIFHNINAEKLFSNCQKKLLAHKQSGDVTSFISNEFIYSSESIWNFSVFFKFWNFFLKNFQGEYNVTDFRYFFIMRFHIAHKNFSGHWTNSYKVIALIFFQKQYFHKCKKKSKKFWKINIFI